MKTISLTAAVLFAGVAFGYDVHTKALTPIEEETRPAGSPMAFVRDGKIDFAALKPMMDSAEHLVLEPNPSVRSERLRAALEFLRGL